MCVEELSWLYKVGVCVDIWRMLTWRGEGCLSEDDGDDHWGGGRGVIIHQYFY
jgi:hypothetical protein